MTLNEMKLKLGAYFAEEVGDGYDWRNAGENAVRALTHYVTATSEYVHAHTYWNQEKLFCLDFHIAPDLTELEQLRANAQALFELTGVQVLMTDCSSGEARDPWCSGSAEPPPLVAVGMQAEDHSQ